MPRRKHGDLIIGCVLLFSACGRTEMDSYVDNEGPIGTFGDESGGEGNVGGTSEEGAASAEATSSGDGDGDGDGDGATGDDTGAECQPYGNPGVAQDQCCEGEFPLYLNGVAGGHCAPTCVTSLDCPGAPGVDPDDSSLQTLCNFWGPSGAPEYCGVICTVDASADECPTGSACSPISSPGLGVCTYE